MSEFATKEIVAAQAWWRRKRWGIVEYTVILTFIGDRLSLDLYLVALINFGFRIFNNVALIRRHFIRG